MIFYKHFIGDYQRKTNRLSILEDGVYRRLLDEYYANEEPLPLERDECFRLVRAIKPNERKAVLKILARYFIKTPDGYIQERAEDEIVEFKGKSEKASLSAKKRWDANAHANASETHMRTHMQLEQSERNASHSQIPEATAKSHSQIPKSEKETSKQPPKPPARKLADGVASYFPMFWEAYPRKVGKKAALKCWGNIKPSKDLAISIVEAVHAQTAQHHFQNGRGEDFIPNPATWLNQGRWDDEITGPPKPKMRSAVEEMEEAGLLDD